MSGNQQKTPEFLQIKGYKYRAKMLAAAVVLLVLVLIIFISIIRSIGSAIRSAAVTNEDSDTDAAASISSMAEISSDVGTVSVVDLPSEASSKPESVSSAPEKIKEEKFDADGKLIIDTDTLGGKKAIAITFDDGPSEYTKELIEGLNERGAHATFFMVGKCVSQYPDVLPLMIEGGHQLGNHTYNHTDIKAGGAAVMNDEIGKTDDAIFNACGQRSTAFRPPYGSYTDELAKSVDKTFTLWSVETLDWKNKDMGKVKNTIVSQAKDGSIVLLHDLYKTSVDGALAAIDQLSGEGYVFVTVDELMTRYGYPVSPGPHGAQFAVYETNSPYASGYAEDMESDKAKEAASTAAGTFYYDRDDGSDTEGTSAQAPDNGFSEDDSDYDSDYVSDYDYYYDSDSDEIRVVESQAVSSRMVY